MTKPEKYKAWCEVYVEAQRIDYDSKVVDALIDELDFLWNSMTEEEKCEADPNWAKNRGEFAKNRGEFYECIDD